MSLLLLSPGAFRVSSFGTDTDHDTLWWFHTESCVWDKGTLYWEKKKVLSSSAFKVEFFIKCFLSNLPIVITWIVSAAKAPGAAGSVAFCLAVLFWLFQSHLFHLNFPLIIHLLNSQPVCGARWTLTWHCKDQFSGSLRNLAISMYKLINDLNKMVFRWQVWRQ